MSLARLFCFVGLVVSVGLLLQACAAAGLASATAHAGGAVIGAGAGATKAVTRTVF